MPDDGKYTFEQDVHYPTHCMNMMLYVEVSLKIQHLLYFEIPLFRNKSKNYSKQIAELR